MGQLQSSLVSYYAPCESGPAISIFAALYLASQGHPPRVRVGCLLQSPSAVGSTYTLKPGTSGHTLHVPVPRVVPDLPVQVLPSVHLSSNNHSDARSWARLKLEVSHQVSLLRLPPVHLIWARLGQCGADVVQCLYASSGHGCRNLAGDNGSWRYSALFTYALRGPQLSSSDHKLSIYTMTAGPLSLAFSVNTAIYALCWGVRILRLGQPSTRSYHRSLASSVSSIPRFVCSALMPSQQQHAAICCRLESLAILG